MPLLVVLPDALRVGDVIQTEQGVKTITKVRDVGCSLSGSLYYVRFHDGTFTHYERTKSVEVVQQP